MADRVRLLGWWAGAIALLTASSSGLEVRAENQGQMNAGPKVIIRDNGTPKVNIRQELAKIGPKVTIKTKPGSQDLLNDVAGLYPAAPDGRPILRKNWNTDGDIAIGSSGGETSLLKRLQDGAIAVIVKDGDGNPVVNVPSSSFVVADLQTGVRRNIQIQRADDGAVSLAFSLLIDVSGSMKSVNAKVREEALAFLTGMGARAQCQVSVFATNRKTLTKGFGPCNGPQTLAAIGKVDSSGKSTNLVQAVSEELQSLNAITADFKGLVVVSDGKETGGGKAAAIQQEKKNPIYSYWIGDPDKTDTILRPVSDAFFPDLRNGSDVLERMLTAVVANHQAIRVIRHVR